MRTITTKLAAILTIASIFSTQVRSQDIPVQLMIDMESFIITNEKHVEKAKTEESIKVRMTSNDKSGRIYIESQTTLTDATLNVTDLEGNPYIAYNFPVLSDLDMSVTRLPIGDYVLTIKSDSGSASMRFNR